MELLYIQTAESASPPLTPSGAGRAPSGVPEGGKGVEDRRNVQFSGQLKAEGRCATMRLGGWSNGTQSC
jgi:hypothetical protein